MEYSETLKKVKGVFTVVFGELVGFNENTSSADVHHWDSLNHVVFISKIEEEFSLRFDLREMLEINTIGDICRVIQSKTGN